MTQTLYRLYTEERQNLARIAGRYFDSFTLLEGSGYFRGLGENSAIIEVIADGRARTRTKVYDLAEAIHTENNQHTVIITEQQVLVVLVGA